MFKRNSLYIILLPLVLCAAPVAKHARQAGAGNDLAPGAPGHDAQWTNAGKDAVGTSNTVESKVWFTLRGGVMTEVYYPTVDVANTRALEFVYTGCGTSLESADAEHRVEIVDPQSLTFRQINTAKSG